MRAKFGCRYRLHKNFSTSSVTSVGNFPGGFADFIFVDGLHTYEGVRNDINTWTTKSKEGGHFIFND